MDPSILHVSKCVLSDRRINIWFIAVNFKVRRHDANNRVTLFVQHHRCSENSLAPAESALPQIVVQNDYWCATRPIFFGQERAPAKQRHAQNGKQVRRCLEFYNVLGFPGLAQRACSKNPPSQFKRPALALAIQKVVVG